MSNRKFFSGLTPTMLTRTQNGQDRQQTHFYWPDEFNSDQVPSPRNRMRNRSLSTASVISQSNASTDTEESRRRRSNNLKSGIEFYDMVDTTDTESVYGRKADPTTHKKLETLKSKIEFYDFADSKKKPIQDDDDANSVIEVVKKKDIQEVEVTPPKVYSNDATTELAKSMNKMTIQNNMKAPQRNISQYAASYGSDSEDDTSRYQKSYRNRDLSSQRYQRRLPLPPQQLQPQLQQRPRRYHSHYFDDFEDNGYERYYESSRRPRLPRMNVRRRDFSPDDISDEEFFDDNRSYARKSNRDNRSSRPMAFSPDREYRTSGSRYGVDYDNYRMQKVSSNGYGNNEYPNESRLKSPPMQQQNEIESEAARAQINSSNVSRPPVKPVQRSMSINEARRRHHFNLKSNIFHNDQEYEKVSERLKPLSVRDFAGNNRVGVGLPDL